MADADKSESDRLGDSGMGFWNEEELRTERLVSFCSHAGLNSDKIAPSDICSADEMSTSSVASSGLGDSMSMLSS